MKAGGKRRFQTSAPGPRLSTWLLKFSWRNLVKFQNGAPGQRVNVDDIVGNVRAVAGRVFRNVIWRQRRRRQGYHGHFSRRVERKAHAALRERNVFVPQ